VKNREKSQFRFEEGIIKTCISTLKHFVRAVIVASVTMFFFIPDSPAQQCLSMDPAKGLRNCDAWNSGCASYSNGPMRMDYVSPNEAYWYLEYLDQNEKYDEYDLD
jgi:hypothetical protein